MLKLHKLLNTFTIVLVKTLGKVYKVYSYAGAK